MEIVGIAQTIKVRDTFDKNADFVYLPMAQHPISRMSLMVRSSGDPLQLVPAVKDVVRRMDPNMSMLHTMTYEDMYLNRAIRGPAVAIGKSSGVIFAVVTVAAVAAKIPQSLRRSKLPSAPPSRSPRTPHFKRGKGIRQAPLCQKRK